MHIINLKVLECQDFYLKFLDNKSMKGEIKEKLRALRLDAGYTQKEMAQKIKSTDKNIWAYEKGLAAPPAEIIVAYAEAFNVSTDYLLGLEDDFGIRVDSKELIKRPDYDITDKQLTDFMKLFKVMTEVQKAQVLGFVIGMLENAGVNVKAVLGY